MKPTALLQGAAHGAAAGLFEGPDDHPPVERATEREDRLPRDRAGREGRGRGGGYWGGRGDGGKSRSGKDGIGRRIEFGSCFFWGYVLGVASFFGLHK